MQLSQKVLLAFCYEFVWLHHIDALFKITIQECCLHIHLPYLIIKMCHTEYEYSDGFEYDYW